MKVAVSDSTPINILIRLGYIDVLPKLFARVVVPPVVAAEMTNAGIPPAVHLWVARPPP